MITEPASELLGPAIDRIEAFVRACLDADGTPAVSLGITDRDRPLHVGAYGLADVAGRVPVTTDHLFEIGSISKSFAAIVVLQLVEEGLLDLHAPITDVVPWFEVPSEHGPITLHHLLSHTAGLVGGSLGYIDGRSEVWALRRTRTGSAPGAFYHYSNVGYETVGLAVTAVTGLPFHEALRRRVLEPLGMSASTPDFTNATRPRLAVGYLPAADDRPYVPGRTLAPATWFVGDTADGAICATPSDMTAYLRCWLNSGQGPEGPLLDPASFAAMTSPTPASSASEDGGYGYGIGVTTREGRAVLEHSGGMVGYVAQAIADLDAGIGVIVMANGPSRVRAIARYAIEVMAAASAGAEPPPVPEIVDRRVVEDAERLAGTYVGVSGAVSIEADGAGLSLRDGDRTLPLTRTREEAMTFVAEHPDLVDAPLEVVLGEGGSADGLFIGRRWYPAGGTATPEPAYPEVWDVYAGLYRTHNPWQPAWRFVVRRGQPWLVVPGSGEGLLLVPDGDDRFRFAEDDRLPERVRFHRFAGGMPLCLELEGLDYHRFADPVSVWNDRAE